MSLERIFLIARYSERRKIKRKGLPSKKLCYLFHFLNFSSECISVVLKFISLRFFLRSFFFGWEHVRFHSQTCQKYILFATHRVHSLFQNSKLFYSLYKLGWKQLETYQN